MATFRYQALNLEERWISGEIEAESVSLAIAELESRGLTVQSIARASVEGHQGTATPVAPALADESDDRERARREIEHVLKGALDQGEAIAPVLRAYGAEMPDGERQRQLEEVIQVLEAKDLTRAAERFPDLAEVWLPLLGSLSSVPAAGGMLARFASRAGQARDVGRSWWLILAYPLTLAGLCLGVLVVLSFLLLPTFRTALSFGQELPLSTRALFAVGDVLRSRLMLVLAAVAASGGLLAAILLHGKPDFGRAQARRLLASWPHALTPRRARAAALGSIALHTADLLEGGASIPGALRIAGLVSSRRPLTRSAWALARALEAPPDAAVPVGANSLSATLQHALRGEFSAEARIRLVREVGACYVEQTRRRSWTIADALGPLGVLLMGMIVLWFLLALFQPLFSFVNLLSN